MERVKRALEGLYRTAKEYMATTGRDPPAVIAFAHEEDGWVPELFPIDTEDKDRTEQVINIATRLRPVDLVLFCALGYRKSVSAGEAATIGSVRDAEGREEVLLLMAKERGGRYTTGFALVDEAARTVGELVWEEGGKTKRARFLDAAVMRE